MASDRAGPDLLTLPPVAADLKSRGGIWHPRGVRTILRRPLLAACIVLTALAGLAVAGVGVGAVIVNPRQFGVGVVVSLSVYGALLILIAWLVARGHRWALGLIVASSLLHACVVASFLTTSDRAQFVGSLIVAPFVAATVVTSVLAVGRGELDRARAAR